MADSPSLIAAVPLLSLVLLSPIVGALVIGLVRDAARARLVALGSAATTLVLALGTLRAFDPAVAEFQLLERMAWIPSLQVEYLLGIDGISVLFLPLTGLLFLAVFAASSACGGTLPRLYFALLLLLESCILGVFCALDVMLFILFWELTLIPLFFLISLWGGGPSRRYAAAKYTLLMLGGGIALVFGFLLLAVNHASVAGGGVPDGLVWDYRSLVQTAANSDLQKTVFLLLLLGFGVKVPFVPLHTWLAVVSIEGPANIAALIMGLKLGAFGLIRFALPLAPEGAQDLHWLLAGLGTVSIVYGALGAMVQTNLRRLLAFSAISHVGLVVLGIASFNLSGVQGAVLQLLNFILVAGGLFLLTGFVLRRSGSSDLLHLGGLGQSMPFLAAFYFFFSMASLGVPGTAGFPGEFLILMSALETHTGAGLTALFAMVLAATYVLYGYRGAFYGLHVSRMPVPLDDLRSRELWIALGFAFLILGFGLFPSTLLDIFVESSRLWVSRFSSVP